MNKEKIIIPTSSTADTRTTDYTKVTKSQLLAASKQHIQDVILGMKFLAKKILKAGLKHDWTKIKYIDMFYDDFKNGFKNTEWWELHKTTERHHLSIGGHVPEDVNLIDVLEFIIDSAVAGYARSGEYRQENIPDDLLEKAFKNTVQMVCNAIEVKNE